MVMDFGVGFVCGALCYYVADSYKRWKLRGYKVFCGYCSMFVDIDCIHPKTMNHKDKLIKTMCPECAKVN